MQDWANRCMNKARAQAAKARGYYCVYAGTYLNLWSRTHRSSALGLARLRSTLACHSAQESGLRRLGAWCGIYLYSIPSRWGDKERVEGSANGDGSLGYFSPAHSSHHCDALEVRT